jgi:alanine racemase
MEQISTSRTWAEINLKSLEKNIEILRTQISNQTKFLAVVKANAYGHGLIEISKKLEELKVDMFGVATVEEALKLRENQIKTPILILGQSSPELFDLISDNEITQTIENIEIAKKFSNFAQNKKKSIKIHIKIDSGMGRIGFFWPEDEKSKKKTSQEIKKISTFPGLKIEGIFTHLAKTSDEIFTNNQIKKFKESIEYLNNLGLKFNIIHAAASVATLNFPSAHFDMCRFGLVMYGYESTENGNENGKLNLEPILKVKSKISTVRNLPKNTKIGYDCTYTLKKDSKIAVLPIGYGDGFPRNLSNKANVKIKGILCPIVGRVCMDMIMVDASDVDEVNEGDVAVVIDEELIVDDVKKSGTIIHEILCTILPRVKRVYVN